MSPAVVRLAGSGLPSKCVMGPSRRLLPPPTSLTKNSAMRTSVTSIATRKHLEISPIRLPERKRSLLCNASAVAAAGK